MGEEGEEPRRGVELGREVGAVEVRAKRWKAGLSQSTLDVPEQSIALRPWRLAICGDFVGDGAHVSPIETAALSGLDAGENVAAFFA